MRTTLIRRGLRQYGASGSPPQPLRGRFALLPKRDELITVDTFARSWNAKKPDAIAARRGRLGSAATASSTRSFLLRSSDTLHSACRAHFPSGDHGGKSTDPTCRPFS